MHLLLFILYGALLGYAIARMPFFRNSGIRYSTLILLFALRVATGCLHNLIAWRYFPHHGDIWNFFSESIVTRHELFTDFHLFIADNSTWAYLPYNIIGFMHTAVEFFVLRQSVYQYPVFFSFFVFGGTVAMFRAFRGFFNDHLLAAVTVFFIPSTLFWTACVHKEGILYLLMGFFFFQLHAAIIRGWNPRRVITLIVLFLIACFFRANMIVTLLPALLIWCWAAAATRRPLLKWLPLPILAAILIVFLIQPAVFTRILQYICLRQSEFQQLQGNSRLPLPVLTPDFSSFARILPTAFMNGFFEPLPGSGGQPIYLAFSWELILIWLVALWALLRSLIIPHSFSICCLVFVFSGMLLVGFTIPFAGTIVRYRSIYLPFLLAPAIYTLRKHPAIQWLNDRLSRLTLNRPH